MTEEIFIVKMETANSACCNVNTLCKNDSKSDDIKTEKTSTKRKLKKLESIDQNVYPHFSKESPQELMRAVYAKRLKMSTLPCSSINTRSRSRNLNKTEETAYQENTKVKTNDQAISTLSESIMPEIEIVEIEVTPQKKKNKSKKVTADKSVKARSKKNGHKNESKHLNFSSPMKIKGLAQIEVTPQKKKNKSKSVTADKPFKARLKKNGHKDEPKHLNFSSPAKKSLSPAVKDASQKMKKRKQYHKIKKAQTSKSSVTESSTDVIETPITAPLDGPVSFENKQIPFRVIQREEYPTTSKESVRNNELQQDLEKKTDYQNLLALTDVNLVENAERFACPICFVDVDLGKGVTLQECIHSFCRECLVNAIMISETAVVRCPFRNDEYSCESHLQDREIKSLLTPEAYEHHLQRSVAFAESQAPNTFHCKTPHCPGWYFLDDDIWYNFICPVCFHTNCINCGAIHEGKDCTQYQDGLKNEGQNYTAYQDQDNIVNAYITIIEGAGKTVENFQRDYNTAPDIEAQSKEPEVEVEEPDYQNLLALENVNLVTNVEQFECPICFSDVDVDQGAVLQECLHSFCRDCLAGAIQFSENAVVQCPFRNDEYSCDYFLQEREIKSLVTPEIYEKYLQRSVALAESQAPNSFHCKTPDCSGWCLFEDAVNTFPCPVCNHTNCLTCAAIHEGKNCKQYQDDLVFMCDTSEEARKTRKYLEDMLHKGKGMKCPQCQIIIRKKEGCDGLMCTMCKTEICWRTKGPRWGPRGRGDISGGCKCNVNGVRCHPKCRNCH